MNKLYIISLFTLLLACTIEKKSEISEDVLPLSGKDIYAERCTSCHGLDGKLGFAGAKDLTLSKKSLEEIIKQVTFGKGAMAPYKNILSTEDIQSVSEYALTIRK